MNPSDVDFVLVSSSVRKHEEYEHTLEGKRSIFERNLTEQGLQIEKETYGCLTFVKLHAPKEVLRRYCEIMKFRMPIKKISQGVSRRKDVEESSVLKSCIEMLKNMGNYFITGDMTQTNQTDVEFKAMYSREKSYLFDEDHPNFFTPTIRILIVHYILNRQTLDSEHPVGIDELINDDVYIAGYPLHDGDYEDQTSTRGLLFNTWAKLKNLSKNQPIDTIEEYLGTKVAFYFSWLGFYTRLLIPASFCGVLVLLYGFLTLHRDSVSQDTCNPSLNVTMCPNCDGCDYYKLSDYCWSSKITYLFDNSLTAVFAVLMAIWASSFFEIWKRYAAVLTHRWSLIEYSVDEELPRPEYIGKVSRYNKFILNKVTEKLEPVVPTWKIKLPVRILSYSTILFFGMLVMIAIVAIMLYRIWIKTACRSMISTGMPFLKNYESYIVYCTSYMFNLISIMALNTVYSKAALYLTNLELHRTHTEHETALTIKIYIFQFINFYSSIMYIAFFKGKFTGLPSKYERIFGERQECQYGSCFLELTVQLAFIMIGKQVLGAFSEMSLPAMKTFFKKYQSKSSKSDSDISLLAELNDLAKAPNHRWIEDFKLLNWEQTGLFSEYLEMVIQFGFVTLFVPAFPLAPLFAFLNNKFEIRLDARKILTYYRRPIPHRIPGIGIWFQILQFLGSLAVLTNAIVIAFSSNFIPRLVFWGYEGSDKNFLVNYLSEMDANDLDPKSKPFHSEYNITSCSYMDLRKPPGSPEKYEPTTLYWQVFIARLIFIILFQNITYLAKSIIDYWIPDEPEDLRRVIKKENYLTTKIIIEHETRLSKNDVICEVEPSPMQVLKNTLEVGVIKMKTYSSTYRNVT